MILRTVSSGLYRVLAACTSRGDCELLSFLDDMEGRMEKDAIRIMNLLDRTAKKGPSKRTEISHQIEDEVYEFIQGRLRVLWFYDEGTHRDLHSRIREEDEEDSAGGNRAGEGDPSPIYRG